MHKYVFFEGIYGHSKYVFKDLEKENNCYFADIPRHGIKGILNHYHTSEKINKKIKLPFKSIWYKGYLRKVIGGSDGYVFVFSEGCRQAYDYYFLSWLKNKYSNAKLVYYFLNSTCELSKKRLDYINNNFDIIVSYDKADCDKYNWNYYCGLYCADKEIKENRTSDVFFVGRNKGRLKQIIESYELFSKANMICDYNIVGVKKEDQKNSGIKYNKPLPYIDVLKKDIGARFLFENLQENQTGCTFRTYEAIVYNKVLISNNLSLKEMRIFDKNRMFLYEKVEDISVDEIKKMEKLPQIITAKDLSPLLFLDFLEEKVDEDEKQ